MLTDEQILNYVQLGQSQDCVAILVETDGYTIEAAMRKVARAQDIPMNRLTRGTTAERDLMDASKVPHGHRFYDEDIEMFLTMKGGVWLTETGVDASEL